MIKMGLPYRYVKYVRSFLSARRTWVDVNGVLSNQFYLNEGLPQGSAISPLLFLIFINDIDEEIKDDDTDSSLFADDTGVWTVKGENEEETTKKMQEAADVVGRWAKKWKMKLNEGKTEAMVISQGKHKWEPKLYLNNKEIKIVDEYKFLG
jgi:hypothetical protein